ncbi:15-hydroxyprostaglandin dehydrogenase [NAD(+)]-like [Zophobas morio]|uniref:15-hydroxyprostaglandin dehydrogenase [NAD(+)]-like n=1 Tax=Zophobas morio TaxID=2755281 RepID=UPI0030831650
MDSVVRKVAFITGGAGGIGLAMVKHLLKNGAKGVAIVDSSEDAESRIVDEIATVFGKDKVVFIKADVTVKEELEGAFDKTIEIYQQLDIVINNAGIVDEVNWKRVVAVNLCAVMEGSYLAMQNYFPKYKSGEEGVIVNTASICAFRTMSVAPSYCTTKHGLIGFAKAVGDEEFYKNYKVRFLTICPGLVDTPIIKNQKVLWSPELREKQVGDLNSVLQSPDRVGEALIEIIKKGKNGSFWVVEEDEPAYEIVVPCYRTMKV